MTSMWFFSSLALLAFASPTPGDKCVCLPDQGCWPSICEWDTLNTTVGGKLSAIYPLGKPCHDPTFDNATCQTIAKLYSNSSWKADQIGFILLLFRRADDRWITTSQLGSQPCVE